MGHCSAMARQSSQPDIIELVLNYIRFECSETQTEDFGLVIPRQHLNKIFLIWAVNTFVRLCFADFDKKMKTFKPSLSSTL